MGVGVVLASCLKRERWRGRSNTINPMSFSRNYGTKRSPLQKGWNFQKWLKPKEAMFELTTRLVGSMPTWEGFRVAKGLVGDE